MKTIRDIIADKPLFATTSAIFFFKIGHVLHQISKIITIIYS